MRRRKKEEPGVIDATFEEPAHCEQALEWLRARGWDLAPLTGQDRPALEAVAHCWALWGRSDTDGREASLRAIAALCSGMQEVCWPMARELAAQALDWGHRGELWPIVCEFFFLLTDTTDEQVDRLRHCAEGHACVRQPDLGGVPNDIGLRMSAERIAAQAWRERLNPDIYDFAGEAMVGFRGPAAKVAELHRRILEIWPAPDADDYAVMLSACCLSRGLHVRLILTGEGHCWTVLVAVRVAFSLDPDQDGNESWHIYGPTGRVSWPNPRFPHWTSVRVVPEEKP